jgi:hypothetical protein
MRDNAWPLISAEFWPLKIAGYYAEQCMDVRVRKRTTFGRSGRPRSLAKEITPARLT